MSHLWPWSPVLARCHCPGLINGFPVCPAMPGLSPAKDTGRVEITKQEVYMCFLCASIQACVQLTHIAKCTEKPQRIRKKTHFPIVPDCSHVDCISIRGQEWLVISQGSDSQNGPSGTLCHSAPVRACPIDPAQLSQPMRDTRLRSCRDSLCCQGLWMMYNIRMVFVL